MDVLGGGRCEGDLNYELALGCLVVCFLRNSGRRIVRLGAERRCFLCCFNVHVDSSSLLQELGRVSGVRTDSHTSRMATLVLAGIFILVSRE